jgi:opacity protein-like surface antigen
MRKLLMIIGTVGAIAWSNAALAVVDESTVTVTNSGKELNGATISLRTPEGKPATVKPAHPTTPKDPTTGKIGRKSTIVVERPRSDRDRDQVIVVWVTLKNGERLPPIYTTANRLMSGGTFDVALFGGGPFIAGPVPWTAPGASVQNTWTGVSWGLGGNVGGAWGTGSFTGGEAVPAPGSFSTSGAFGGGTIDFNMGWGNNWVLRAEGQFEGGHITGSTNNACDVGCRTTVDFFGTVTPAIGYLLNPNLLASVNGGWAFGKIHAGVGDLPGVSSFQNGWTVGAGFEWQFAANWWLDMEYKFVDLGKFGCTLDGCGGTEDVKTHFNIFEVGVKYQWAIPSDVRLKRDIVPVGRLSNGLHLYRFRYEWSDQLYVGVMAQEVQQIMPEAIVRGPYGYLVVDYGKVGTELRTWDEFVASNPVTADGIPE